MKTGFIGYRYSDQSLKSRVVTTGYDGQRTNSRVKEKCNKCLY